VSRVSSRRSVVCSQSINCKFAVPNPGNQSFRSFREMEFIQFVSDTLKLTLRWKCTRSSRLNNEDQSWLSRAFSITHNTVSPSPSSSSTQSAIHSSSHSIPKTNRDLVFAGEDVVLETVLRLVFLFICLPSTTQNKKIAPAVRTRTQTAIHWKMINALRVAQPHFEAIL
jgi:hypothetical protein